MASRCTFLVHLLFFVYKSPPQALQISANQPKSAARILRRIHKFDFDYYEEAKFVIKSV